jgi:hypothetical protein
VIGDLRLIAGMAIGLCCGVLRAQVAVNNGPISQNTPTVSTLTTGTVLEAGGYVSGDGRYVTLDTHVSQSDLNGLDTFGSSAPLGRQFIIDVRGRAVGTARLPYRPAEADHVTVVENDRAILGQMVPEIAADHVSLRAALREMGKVSGVNIAVGWKAMRDANIDELQPRKFSLPQGTLRASLRALLKQALPRESMVITAEDNVVFITTQAQADNTVVTKWYYTADLLANAPRWMPQDTDLGQVGLPAKPVLATAPDAALEKKPDDTSSVPSLFATAPPPPQPLATKAVRSASTSIAELITSTVRPEIWKCNGGKVGEISEVRDRVMITAPQSVQALLEGPHYYDPNAVPKYVGYHP